MKVFVEHSGYGCDTGCCGHVITVEDDAGNEVSGSFQWEHPDREDHRAWAERLVSEELGAEHVADLDWDQCVIVED